MLSEWEKRDSSIKSSLEVRILSYIIFPILIRSISVKFQIASLTVTLTMHMYYFTLVCNELTLKYFI